MSRPTAHVIAGGTIAHVRPHLALCAPAYGGTGKRLMRALEARGIEAKLHKTKMAGGPADLETNEDVARLVAGIVADPAARMLFMPVALCDFTGSMLEEGEPTMSGLDAPRLESRTGPRTMLLTPADKVIAAVRRTRKDLFLVAFKATAGAAPTKQLSAGLRLLKSASANLVFANDVRTGAHQIITPEEASYHAEESRDEALAALVEMAALRSSLRFTRSTIVPGEPVPWSSSLIPETLRRVVDHAVARGAYKPFLGTTVGHFAVSLGNGQFLTSRRKTDFNRLRETGLVLVEARGQDEVIAHGFRPSVGGQSQRIVFSEHPELDCIVHFHCPKRPASLVPVRSQRPYECGSHECGANTSRGLARFDDHLYAVMLDRHGPNIVFSRDCDPAKIITFIEQNFDLEGTTRALPLPVEVTP
ncbi:MAG: hypothetical protein HOV80_09385 [Polyangiaceae bacterium]|nr:hypothetical protein [Polyangiaceae bacterium]